MLTIFACPRPFGENAHIDVIQMNAIRSWAEMVPYGDITLVGDIDSNSDLSELDVSRACLFDWQEPPLLRDVFMLGECVTQSAYARAGASYRWDDDESVINDVHCYANADIILTGLVDALRIVKAAGFEEWLMVGYRRNVNVDTPIDFDGDWQGALDKRASDYRDAFHPDYFCYSRGLWPPFDEWPDLLLGRTKWDSWLIATAKKRGAAVVDVTSMVDAYHQNHPPLAYGDKKSIAKNEAIMHKTKTPWSNLHSTTHILRDGKVAKRKKAKP